MRGYIPPQNDEERALQKKISGICTLVEKTGEMRITGFLNDREIELATASANKSSCGKFEFYGGYDNAERKQMCICGFDLLPQYDISFIEISVKGDTQKLTHRDYLGALMALGIKRECIGDILLSDSHTVVFVQSHMADYICTQLFEIGRCSASANELSDIDIQKGSFDAKECTANVQSLRLDSILAAMLKTSRTNAVKLIDAKSVMINHIVSNSSHTPIYDNDTITVKGKGKFKIIETDGRSKKGRIFVTFLQF